MSCSLIWSQRWMPLRPNSTTFHSANRRHARSIPFYSANSRIRPSIWSLVRIDQTCLGQSVGLAPMSFPLFQGVRVGAGGLESAWSCSFADVEDDHGVRQTGTH